MEAFTINHTTFRLQTAADPDTSVISVQATPFGRLLAQLLDGQPQPDGDYLIQHTPELDGRMLAVIDALITLRYQHPTAVQLQLALPERLT